MGIETFELSIGFSLYLRLLVEVRSRLLRIRLFSLQVLENFNKNGLDLRILAQKGVTIPRVLDEAEKLNKQFLLGKIETLPAKLIDCVFEFDDTGL